MTYTLITALIGSLATLPVPVASPDFTGTWVLEASRNEGMPPGYEQSLMVRQAGDRIEVEMHQKTSMGEQRFTDEFILDGNETDFRPPVPAEVSATGRRTSRWSEDGNGFESVERAVIQGPEGEVTITATRKWALAPGGDELTTVITINGPQGEQTSTRVYTRQKS